MSEHRRSAWERGMEWPLTSLAVLFLLMYALPILRPDLSPSAIAFFEYASWIIWATFLGDYLVRWGLSRSKRRFLWTTLPDAIVMVLPMLRPLRLLRLLTLLAVLNRRASSSLRGRVAVYVVGASTLIIFCSSLAVLDAERESPGANIVDFGDAVWWAATTVTTVGYGDRYPTTSTGRIVAGLLMLGGIALLGIVTAGLASWLLDRIREVEVENRAATSRDVEQLTAEVQALREEVRRFTARRLGDDSMQTS